MAARSGSHLANFEVWVDLRVNSVQSIYFLL
jgi:hypothetical protein